ncbi:MAG: SPOR domain-containing protein [Shewanella algae]|uniref:SPOR domain-containing protein n=1 Tax=Shewanella TaxID=22 RepID=UPI000C334684|nr:SPOR domain-containing protein [Shewanella algae]MBO2582016.1 SPOR domain-containing protein [Shewanella algae]MBO2603175.1 SPOR domain-containing protein [Shewanella algae]MBO2641035.1 SPOR domain-containing protein [Shewanella algae]PSS74783.1 hypothetical protein AYI88_03390 [Shewanella algae]TWO86065.1 hypothetical protein AYI75_02870 [Shewanella algae]
MSTQFHNRLVGTVVLVALGVIFLPDILDGKKERQQEQFTEIPLRPDTESQLAEPGEFETLDVAETLDLAQETDELQVEVEPAAPEVKATENSVSNTAQSKPQEVKKTPEPKAKPSDAAWTLQLGAFSNAANVKALVAKLRKAGFSAYTLPDKPVDGKLTRVFVGPDVSSDRIKQQQKKVEELTKLKGKVVRYNPQER